MSETITIKVVTGPGVKASIVGEAFASVGYISWRDSVDNCDDNGHGRVFLDCPNDDSVDYIENELENDDRVISYETV